MNNFQNLTLALGLGRGKRRLEVNLKFVDGRFPTECKEYPFKYSIRGGANNDCGQFASIEKFVCVNFCGYAFSKTEIPLQNGVLPIKDYWFTS